ncbi:protein FAM81B [Myxocyprinus asiaticus]|uniref:protein FAM81B n=1 Tax=Myxocyprinus asiaticus TaxID=70543 RepID=UPI0022229E68|nr:protein FAM81B [Myxocyprinus asiaticus]XP_051518738.1 protein FAM81B [Myxocyprinus asiaticus]XP_051518747.1 protein FAM81B [Myxocyprinus asiaticus]
MSHETALQPYPSHEKSGYLESRMSNQDRTLSTLLEQAFKIKDDVVTGLRAAQGSVLMESSARKLLESHIQTITHIVRQLSKNIQVLETQIIERDHLTAGTTFAVKSLDHKNMTGIGDLRGRVARCDASISKLSADVGAGGWDILKLQKEVSELRSGLELKLRDMELKLFREIGKLDTSLSEKLISQRNATGLLQKEMQRLEVKTSSGLKEMEEETVRLRKWAEEQLKCTVQTHTENSQQLHTLLQDTVVEMEGKLKEHMVLLSGHLENMEARLGKERSADKVKRSDSKVNSKISTLEKSFREELEQMRREYQSGFQAVHDAIASLRHIGDAKAKLDKVELQRDIRQIQKNAVGLKKL